MTPKANKTISMKKLYQWASEYPNWKRDPKNNHGTSEEAIAIGMVWISDYLAMLWDKRRESK